MSSAVSQPTPRPDLDAGAQRSHTDAGTTSGELDRGTVLDRQKERFGGMKAGSAFFGWLTATGTSVILLALIAAIATGIGSNSSLTQQDASQNAGKLGLAGAVVLVVVVFVAYVCGGYVAGRMARFNGLRQGVGVWLWALVITVVVAILGAIAGNQFNVLSRVGAFPQLPTSASNITVAGIISLVVIAVAALAGAILGGLTGMRFHRRVDRADLADQV